MPKTKQLQLKRQWAQGMNDLEKAAMEIARLQEIFNPTHPDYVQLCEASLIGLYVVIEAWGAFAKNAWGKLPKHTTDWMQ